MLVLYSVMCIQVLLLSAGLAAAYIITALTSRADTLVTVEYTKLLAEGKPLYENFCVCNATTLRWADFTTVSIVVLTHQRRSPPYLSM
jgi:hypothetical protein